MTHDEFETDVQPLADRLMDRPVPASGFRGELRRRLLAQRGAGPRPARLRALIAGYAAAGATLLTVGALVS